MAYRLKHDEPIDREVRRLAAKQLRLAIANLRGTGAGGDDLATHTARRHLKKIRALLRLARPILGADARQSDAQFKAAIRLLAAIADGQAMVETMGRLHTRAGRSASAAALGAAHAVLVRRQRRLGRRAAEKKVRREVISLLEAELERVPEWQVHGSGFRAVRKGLHRTIRDARHAMREAQRTPTNSAWLRWRHHVKAHWFQVRLLAGRTGNGLVLLERRLEALDGFLGDHHDCALLERVLTREALVTREQTAACLRVLGRYRSELRRQARTLGAVVYRQKAARQVQAIEERWLALGRTRARPTPVRRRRPRAAAPSTAAASPPVPLHAA